MNAVSKKYFTLEEANQTLPLVRAIVTDIVRQYREVHELRERLQGIRRGATRAERERDNPYSEEVAQMEDDLERDIEKLQAFVEELHSLGVELKDFTRGLVDFPCWMDDHEVSLCWHLGEQDIGYWHEVDAGFQGRQALLQSSPPRDA